MTPPPEQQSPTGWATSGAFLEAMSRLNATLGEALATARLTREDLHMGLSRVHERIDDVHQRIDEAHSRTQDHLDHLRARMVRMETRAQPSRPAPRGLLSRLKCVAALVAPMRELLLVAVAILGSLYAMLQPSPVKEALGRLLELFPGG